MREIKLRYVWERPKSGAGSYCLNDPKVKITYNSLSDMESYNTREAEFNEPPPYSWENGHEMGKFSILIARDEYTGLKDKNGKEAYYDDIENFRDCLWLIVWDNEYVTTMLKRIKGEHPMKEIPGWNIVRGEVIGNIYENPELLEVSREE